MVVVFFLLKILLLGSSVVYPTVFLPFSLSHRVVGGVILSLLLSHDHRRVAGEVTC